MAGDPVTAADAALMGFLQSIELVVIDAYRNVLTLVGDDKKPIATKFQSHHQDYSAALGRLAGSSAAKVPNGTLALVVAGRVQGLTDEKSALTFAFNLENQVTETYAFALAAVTSPDVVTTIASVLPVMAQHAASLGALAVLPTASLFPNGALEGAAVGGTDNADPKLGFDPVAFPVG
jgi:hypothetical protein